MRLAVLLVLACGCGRIGFGPSDAGGAGGGDDAPGGGGDGGGGGGGDAQVTADGAMPDALISTGCATTTIIDDAFTTGSSAQWTLVNTGSFNTAELSGIVRFSVNGNATAGTRVALQWNQTRSLAGTCAIAELSRAGTGANVRSYLRIGAPAKNIEIYVENNQLWGRFTTNGGGTTGTNGPAAYNAAQMRFLRIRHTGGTSYALEYGPDLSTWNAFATQGGTLVDPSPTFIEFGALVAGPPGGATTVEFDRVLFLGP